MIKFLFKTVAFAFALLSFVSCKSYMEKTADKFEVKNYIRVLLTPGNDVNIKNTPTLFVKYFKTNEVITLKNFSEFLNIRVTDNKTYLNNEEITEAVTVYDTKNNLINLNDKSYFGTLKIIPGENVSIINYLPLDLYLLSVVPSEVPVTFAMEALKTQVIIARTYAYLFMKKYGRKREFDVDDTTRYQVYSGYNILLYSAHIEKIKKAIDDTYNQIITYKDQPILAYFHSNSGGKTVSGSDYFGMHSDYPYLPGNDDPYSLNYPGSSWEYEISINDFKDKMKITEDIKEEQLGRRPDGFLEKISIENKIFTPRDIRKAFGYGVIKSERFKIDFKVEENKVLFTGAGFGHGVGLSQWGAQGMALHGIGCRDIILFYYPNTEIKYLQDEN